MPTQLHTSTHHHFPPPLLHRTLILSAHHRPILRRLSVIHGRFRVTNCTKSSSENTVTELVKAIDGQRTNEQLQQQQVKKAYPFHEIEPKWQHYWEENKTFRTPDEIDTSKPKFYVLDMFPYPRHVLFPHSFSFKFLCASPRNDCGVGSLVYGVSFLMRIKILLVLQSRTITKYS
ncbi:hypothetical protein FXO38_16528 [Capsicum annuum]